MTPNTGRNLAECFAAALVSHLQYTLNNQDPLCAATKSVPLTVKSPHEI